jgi:glycosyltransferase involved in cell wall biosynthesis
MYLQHISDLQPAQEQAVIINVGTKLVSTLALMSALKHANMPILVIDCESTDGSVEHFTELMQHYRFDLLSAPLQNHGLTLDWLFRHIPAQKVLLVDSDLEILDSAIIDLMRMVAYAKRVFGSGFAHGGEWMTMHKQPFGFYEQRPWIPLVMLDVALIREALDQQVSFLPRTVHNDFPPSPFISRMLIKRFRIPVLRNMRLGVLDIFRHDFHGIKPSFIQYDTGADMYQYLVHTKHYKFIGFPWRLNERYATHFHGVTRLLLNRRDRNGTKLEYITDVVARRLHENYDLPPEILVSLRQEYSNPI